MKNELKTIIQGTSSVSYGALIQTIALHLRRSKETGTLATTEQYSKRQETHLTAGGILYFIDTVFYIKEDVFYT